MKHSTYLYLLFLFFFLFFLLLLLVLSGMDRASGELYTCVISVWILLYINWESVINDCCWSLLYESSYGFLF